MPEIQLIKSQHDVQLEKGWKNYFTHGEIIDEQGRATLATEDGKKYKVVAKHVKLFTTGECILHVLGLILAVIFSIGLTLMSKKFRDTFVIREKSIKLFTTRYLNDSDRSQKNIATLHKIYAECQKKSDESCQEFRDAQTMKLKNFDAEQVLKLLKCYRDNELPKGSFAQEFETLEGWVNGKNFDLKKRHLLWMGDVLRTFKKQLSSEQNKWLSDEKILRAIQTFARPDLRPALCNAALSVAKNSEGQIHFKNLCKGKTYKGLPKLLRLLVAQFMQEGVQPTVMKKILSEIESLEVLSKKANSRVLVSALLQLIDVKMLSANEKQCVLERIFMDEQADKKKSPESRAETILANLKSASGTIIFRAPEALLRHQQPLPTILENVFRQKVPVKKIDNFVDCFYKTFGSSRKPSAVIDYAAKILELDDPDVAECFIDYVSSVLTGTFLQKRYQTTNNFHLETLSKSKEGLLETWQRSLPAIPLETADSQDEVSEENKMEAWLKDKFLNDPAFLPQQLVFLNTYLNLEDKQEREQLAQSFTEKLNADKSLEKQQKDALQVKMNLLRFEEKCLELMGETKRSTKQSAIAEIQKLLPLVSPENESLTGKLALLDEAIKKHDKPKSHWHELKDILLPHIDTEALDLKFLGEALQIQDFELEALLIQNTDEALKQISAKLSTISKPLILELKKTRGQIAKSQTQNSDRQEILVNKLQQQCLRLVTASHPDQQKLILEDIRDLIENKYKECSFLKDVNKSIKSLGKPKLVPAKIRVEDSDDPIDLLLLTTEAGNDSCLSIDGYNGKNKCILAYLMDGKNRALMVKDTQDIILARCVIRLMWDEQNQRPVLLRENFYPSSKRIPEDYINALNAMAEQKAAQLGISLVCLDGNGAECPTLKALGSCVPYEYCDAADGLFQNGKFEVEDACHYK